MEVGGQRWSVPSHINAVATNVFRLTSGDTYTLTITRGVAISPSDDTVSLYWDIIPGSSVLVNGTTNAIINAGGDAIGTFSYIVEPIKLVMSRPDDQAASRYFHNSFDDSSPGVCGVACIVEVMPNSNRVQAFVTNKVLWTIGAIGGSALTWQNGGAGPGLGVYDSAGDWREKAFFTSLPADNDEFGIKNLVVSLDGLSSSQSGKTKIFFSRDAKNHPGAGSGVTPNWYYYWQQGAVSGGLDEFEYGGEHALLNGRYVPSNDTLYVYSAAAQGLTSTLVTHRTNDTLQFTIGVDATGIDAVAAIVLHEKEHKRRWHNRNILPDSDHDGIPDMEEGCAPYYFDKNHPDTYNLSQLIYSNYYAYGDQEFLCRMAEQGYISDPTKDWSRPGKQWTYGTTEY